MKRFIGTFIWATFLAVSTADFVSDTNDILDKANSTLKIQSCIRQARRKGNLYEGTREEKAAVTLVNLYTQECRVKYEQNKAFYFLLNAGLSGGLISATGFNYMEFGKLLNVALDILNPEFGVVNNQLYRGQCGLSIQSGETYKPRRFFSTSTNPTNAFTASCFIIIDNASGLSVKEFSAVPKENEVLIKYTATYVVKKNTNDTSEIDKTFLQLGVNVNKAYTRLIVLHQQNFIQHTGQSMSGAPTTNRLVILYITVLSLLLTRCP